MSTIRKPVHSDYQWQLPEASKPWNFVSEKKRGSGVKGIWCLVEGLPSWVNRLEGFMLIYSTFRRFPKRVNRESFLQNYTTSKQIASFTLYFEILLVNKRLFPWKIGFCAWDVCQIRHFRMMVLISYDEQEMNRWSRFLFALTKGKRLKRQP